MNFPQDRYGRAIISLSDISGLPHTESYLAQEWRMCCPVHQGNNPTSFSVDLATGQYHCFACGVAGQLREFWKLNQAQFSQLPRPLNLELKKSGRVKKADKTIFEQPRLLGWLKQAQLNLDNTKSKAYLAQRGIRVDTARKLGLGYVPQFQFLVRTASREPKPSKFEVQTHPAILFPLYTPAGLVNFYARGITPTQRLHRVLRGNKGIFNPQAFRCTTHLKNYPVILVEGCFDAVAMLEAGYPSVVALAGTCLIEIEWYKHLDQLILAFDHDEAGQLAQAKAVQQLKNVGVKCFTLPSQLWGQHKDFAAFWQAEGKHQKALNWRQVLNQTKNWD